MHDQGSSQRQKERVIVNRLKKEVTEYREQCLRILRRRGLDTAVTYGDGGGETGIEQLNPAEEQGMEEENQEEEEERSTSEGQRRKGGLRHDVATEEEKEKDLGEEEGEEGREAVAAPSPISPSRLERESHELTHTHTHTASCVVPSLCKNERKKHSA